MTCQRIPFAFRDNPDETGSKEGEERRGGGRERQFLVFYIFGVIPAQPPANGTEKVLRERRGARAGTTPKAYMVNTLLFRNSRKPPPGDDAQNREEGQRPRRPKNEESPPESPRRLSSLGIGQRNEKTCQPQLPESKKKRERERERERGRDREREKGTSEKR
jgi:hypothetical protein